MGVEIHNSLNDDIFFNYSPNWNVFSKYFYYSDINKAPAILAGKYLKKRMKDFIRDKQPLFMEPFRKVEPNGNLGVDTWGCIKYKDDEDKSINVIWNPEFHYEVCCAWLNNMEILKNIIESRLDGRVWCENKNWKDGNKKIRKYFAIRTIQKAFKNYYYRPGGNYYLKTMASFESSKLI